MAEMESLLARQPTKDVKPVRRDYTKLRKKFSQLFNAQQRYINNWKQLRDYQLPLLVNLMVKRTSLNLTTVKY